MRALLAAKLTERLQATNDDEILYRGTIEKKCAVAWEGSYISCDGGALLSPHLWLIAPTARARRAGGTRRSSRAWPPTPSSAAQAGLRVPPRGCVRAQTWPLAPASPTLRTEAGTGGDAHAGKSVRSAASGSWRAQPTECGHCTQGSGARARTCGSCGVQLLQALGRLGRQRSARALEGRDVASEAHAQRLVLLRLHHREPGLLQPAVVVVCLELLQEKGASLHRRQLERWRRGPRERVRERRLAREGDVLAGTDERLRPLRVER